MIEFTRYPLKTLRFAQSIYTQFYFMKLLASGIFLKNSDSDFRTFFSKFRKACKLWLAIRMNYVWVVLVSKLHRQKKNDRLQTVQFIFSIILMRIFRKISRVHLNHIQSMESPVFAKAMTLPKTAFAPVPLPASILGSEHPLEKRCSREWILSLYFTDAPWQARVLVNLSFITDVVD